MSKLNTGLRIIKSIIKNPYLLKRILNDQGNFSWESVVEKHGFAKGLPTVDILDLFPDFSIAVNPYSFLEGTSTVLDIALLNAFAKRFEYCDYLEIGTWRGESVANVAKYAENCVSISLSNEEMFSKGLSHAFVNAHKFFSKGIDNIQYIEHDSTTLDYSILGKKFDLIFVDGDHSYESVRCDTRNVFSIIKDTNSIIVWHDYGYSPEQIRWEVLAGILDGCPPNKKNDLYHISNTLCAVYLPQNHLEASHTQFPELPNKTFIIQIESTRLNKQ